MCWTHFISNNYEVYTARNNVTYFYFLNVNCKVLSSYNNYK